MKLKLNDKWKNIPALNSDVYTPQMSFVQESRIIKHWDYMAVIPFKHTPSNKWTKYNLPELIWINIVSELRDFGIPLPKIKEAFDTIVGKSDEQWRSIIYYLIFEPPIKYDIVIGKKEIYQLINNHTYFWIGKEFKPSNPIVVVPKSYLNINVNYIIERTLRNEELPNAQKLSINYFNRKLDNVMV